MPTTEPGPPDLRGQYVDAYVQWLDESASAECLEDRLAAGLALADTVRRLKAAGRGGEHWLAPKVGGELPSGQWAFVFTA